MTAASPAEPLVPRDDPSRSTCPELPGTALIDAERLRLANRQVVRAPLGVLFAASFVGYMMAPHVGAVVAWGWAATAIAVWAVRALVSAVLLARPPAAQHLRGWIRYLTVSTTASGLVAGSAAFWFFGVPQLEWAMMTMVLCAWGAAGIAVSGAVPVAFVGLASFFLGPLAVAWAVSTMPLRLPVAGLLLFFLFYLIAFARDSAQLVARALRAGFENEELARQLRVREAEAQAARARAEEANLAKSRFLAAASHDLRQPLHSLSLLLDHALNSAADPKLAATLRQAARSANSLGHLFTGLLDLSRLDAGSLKPEICPVSLGVLLRRLENDFRPLALDKGLAFDCAAPQTWVLSDAALLERILRNLLDNAVKYTAAGRIELHVEDADAAMNSASGRDGRMVRIAVRDTGIGIEPSKHQRIFEEYYQVSNPARNRAQGSGLGLAIVKRIGELLGHRIELVSVPGQGSEFSVTVPRSEPPRAHAAGEALPSSPSLATLHGMVVVLIEDDEEVSAAMRTLLLDWGCRPLIAGDSVAAIAKLEAAGLDPDAVIADWRLSGAESGLQAIERLNARYGERPAMLVSGDIEPAEFPMPRHLEVSVMRKPLRASAVSDWLLRWAAIG